MTGTGPAWENTEAVMAGVRERLPGQSTHDYNRTFEAVLAWMEKFAAPHPSPTADNEGKMDSQRLDWMEANGRFNDHKNTFTVCFSFDTVKLHTIREAVDAAREAQRAQSPKAR